LNVSKLASRRANNLSKKENANPHIKQ